MKKLTVKDLINLKGKRKITMITAVDYFTAKAAEQAGIDMIMIAGTPIETNIKGNSCGNKATLEEVLFCLEGVRKGAPNTFLIGSIPYGYSFISDEETMKTVTALMKGGVDSIRLQIPEGGERKIKRIVEEGIPCSSHVGLAPWFASSTGGLRSVGKGTEEALKIYKNALKLQEAGVIWIEMECVPYKVAAEITKRLDVITIGIGCGDGCDGQVLHSEDILGVHDWHYPKHTKKYFDSYGGSVKAFKMFREEVSKGIFPRVENSFEIERNDFDEFTNLIDDI